jgi:hypothetical protein
MNENLKPGDGVPRKWKRWFHDDRQHTSSWRKEAIEAFDFIAGRQWSEEDKRKLRAELRPAITFNRATVIIDAVAGNEIQGRQEIRYLPREQGDAVVNELYSEAARWFDDQSDAEDEDSEAFMDSLICGMGWTESRLDFDDEPEGSPIVERIDPVEMYWDASARKSNLKDARRLWRVKTFSEEEVKERWPGVPKSDLDATQWTEVTDKSMNVNNPTDRYEDEDIEEDGGFSQDGHRRKTYRIAHLQYWVYENYYKVADPFSGKVIEMDEDRFNAINKKLGKFGLPLKGVKLKRRKFMQAFIGNAILEHGPGGSKEHFTWKCITAKNDRSKGWWYGMVRAMKGPQEWSNKWLSQILHILNSNAKGGLLYESGAFANQAEAESNWAKPNALIEMNTGAIGGSKIMPRDAATFPTGYQMLTEYAMQAIRDVTGVSQELMGMREANQPGVLEYQRRQSGMTVLSPLFNSLRRYRKERGRLLLYYITNHLSDGRLIRITGDEGHKYVPLVKQADTRYDVIVDDAPTSPNQKEIVWQSLMQILPGVKDLVPPEVLLQLLEYSPVPASVVEKIKAVIKAKEPEQKKQAQMAAQAAVLELNVKQAEATETMADAKLKEAKAVSEIASVEQEKIRAATEQTKNMAELAIQRAEFEHNRSQAETENSMRVMEFIQQQKESQDKAMNELLATLKDNLKPTEIIYNESGEAVGIQ